MSGPSQELINRCYTILARCEQFSSLNNLRAVFVSEELRPFRDRLLDAKSVDERIRLNVDYLLDQMTADRRHVFPLFLQALLPASEKDALYSELEHLRVEFEQALGQVDRIVVPYVVAAMTRSEADSLQTGQVFQDREIAPVERERFETLRPALPGSWVKDYGERRDEWRLHTDHKSVIGQVLDMVFDEINYQLRQPENLPLIAGDSLSEKFFSPEHQGKSWEYLRRSGGLLIVDVISLFYPSIRKALVDSGLAARDEIAVLILSPLDFHALPANNCISELIKKEWALIFTRFARNLDHRYEMGSGNLYGIQRWLFNLFSRPDDMATIINERKKRSHLKKMRDKMRDKMRRERASASIGSMGRTIFHQRQEVER